ncbi:DUF945 family protein [uncultured Psychromonas sp.]|uniref:DUF945 family protein n=1 Tax=uncultured Psychromonas sp. TaxID=173974 RepID=UPI0026247724|nr:DUF945 family protein [uncultured Psychromonas sp.]
MKKLIIVFVAVFCVLLSGIYFVGEMAKTEIQKQINQSNNSLLTMELLSYQKYFFSAKAEMKVSIELEGQVPLELLVHSDISHYPYKALLVNYINLVDPVLEKKVVAFFQTKDWLISQEEINLLGNMSGKIALAKGELIKQKKRFNTAPLNFTYEYNVEEKQGSFDIDWAGMDGNIYDETFSVKDLSLQASFTQVKNSDLLDYQYNLEVDQVAFIKRLHRLSMKAISLEGASEISADKLTVDTDTNWKIEKFQNGADTFSNNHINLAFSELNLIALTKLKSNLEETTLMRQAFGHLVSLGAIIDLKTLYSETPWGEVNSQFKMNIQAGVAGDEVLSNPLVLIDYTNGELNLNLPKKLSEQADVGGLLQVGILTGVLKEQNETLVLESTLDRGELTVNGNVLPL